MASPSRCSTCNGRGYFVTRSPRDPKTKIVRENHTACPECKGYGYHVPAGRPKKEIAT